MSIKIYDKFRLILRIETTVVNVSFFKHYRTVEHRDGTSSMAWAEMKKSIYSLAPLRELLLAANRGYLEFISTIEDDWAGTDKLNKTSQPVEENHRNYSGFNFFDPGDEKPFRALASGEFSIFGDIGTNTQATRRHDLCARLHLFNTTEIRAFRAEARDLLEALNPRESVDITLVAGFPRASFQLRRAFGLGLNRGRWIGRSMGGIRPGAPKTMRWQWMARR